MTQRDFDDLCRRFSAMNLDDLDCEDGVLFQYAFQKFLETIEPMIDKYVPKKKVTVHKRKSGFDGRIEPLE